MVRLVFRPYTQVRKAICTSAHLEPPPEFPLASPCSGIVHHLSGPSVYTRTLILCISSREVDAAGTGHRTSQVPYASWVCHPPARIHVRLLGPCFKTGRLVAFRQYPEDAVPEGLKERPEDLDPSSGRTGVTIPGFVPPDKPILTSDENIQPGPMCACSVEGINSHVRWNSNSLMKQRSVFTD